MRLVVALATALTAAHLQAQGTPSKGVDVRTFQFAPDTLRISVGTKVVWTNQDDIEHTITAGTPSERDAAFDQVLKAKGSSAERTFDRAGTFTYFCDRHQFMRGSITITR
jgi:plastocyanin